MTEERLGATISVSQLNEFTENIKTKFESRLTTLDRAGDDIGQFDVYYYLLIKIFQFPISRPTWPV